MKQKLAEIILERSFKYRDDPPFTLASGRTSNYYFNCKPTTLDPEGMYLIGNILFEMLSDSDVDAAGGLTLGADPIANALSLISYEKGKPIKWRVENSWGATIGDKGYMYMMDEWFDEYVFEITVRKEYLSQELLSVLCTKPIVLPPWDPMGGLAKKN